MAVHGLCVLGVVLLLNFASEVHGFQNTCFAQNGDYMQPCMEPELNYEVEFHRIQREGGKLYRRWKINPKVLSCIMEAGRIYPAATLSATDMRQCHEQAVAKGYKSFFPVSQVCGYSNSSIPKGFLTCGARAGDDEILLYTTTDTPNPYTLPGGHKFESCEVTIDAAGRITLEVDDSGRCDLDTYLVKYNNPPGQAYIKTQTPTVMNVPLAACQMVNFTIHRVLGEVPLGSDFCEAAILTGPGNPGSIDRQGDLVVVRLPNCEYLEYKVSIKKFSIPAKVTGPFPARGQTLTYTVSKDLELSDLRITFFSDFNTPLPPPLVFINSPF